MSKSIFVTAIGITALFVLQGFWLYHTYTLYIIEKKSLIDEMFKLSIDKELSLRQFSYDDPENPQFVFKDADSMSPEEKEHLKGDTIDYKSLSEKGVAQSFSEAVSQFQQEQLLRVKPLRVNVLDSVFRKELSCHNLFFSNCVVIRFDRDMVVVDSVGTCPLYDLGVVTTDLRPIGLYAAQFVQAKVQLKPTTIMMELLYNLMISFGIAVFIIAVLYYQLVIIERGRRVLKGRESAVYNAIHDLKSPLNGTFALLDAVSGIVKGDAMMVDSLRKGKSQIKRMTEMIESMLDTTLRIDSGTLLKINRIDLVGMVRMLEEEIPLNFSNKRYVFRVEDRLKESWIWTDRVLLERCLRNLIENALKYSDDGVVITVSLSQDEEYVHISVKDTGWGIPKEMQKKIGKLFFKMNHVNRPNQPGYGIGLCSVKTQIRKLGGFFYFQSKEGVGSTFFLEIPKQIRS